MSERAHGRVVHSDQCCVTKECVCVCVQEEHRRDMEEVLVVQTLMGLSAAKELNDSLRASVEKQRALADKVGPRQ